MAFGDLPIYNEMVKVRVVGNSNSRKERLYFLAISAAYGAIAIKGRASMSQVNITYDYLGKEVVVDLVNQTGSISIVGGRFAAFRNAGITKIIRSIDERLNGFNWAGLLFAEAARAGVVPLPGLPDQATTILNSDSGRLVSFPPFRDIHTPVGSDTAGSYIKALVTQALAGDDCFDQPQTPDGVVADGGDILNINQRPLGSG